MLKHRQNKNQKMRVVVFVASPVDNDTKEVSNNKVITQNLLICYTLH